MARGDPELAQSEISASKPKVIWDSLSRVARDFFKKDKSFRFNRAMITVKNPRQTCEQRRGQSSLCPMNRSEKLTDDILKLVTASLPQDEEDDDEFVDDTLCGIAAAYAAVAYGIHTKEQAKQLLLNLAKVFDDPAALHWVKTHWPEGPEWQRH